MSSNYIPTKGDIVWLDFSSPKGHEQSGRRPALCISPKEYNQKVGLAIFCPITSNKKGYPFEVLIPPSIGIEGVILSDHVKNLDWKARNAEFITSLPPSGLKEVIGKLQSLLRLSGPN